jgi:hypothetical protein
VRAPARGGLEGSARRGLLLLLTPLFPGQRRPSSPPRWDRSGGGPDPLAAFGVAPRALVHARRGGAGGGGAGGGGGGDGGGVAVVQSQAPPAATARSVAQPSGFATWTRLPAPPPPPTPPAADAGAAAAVRHARLFQSPEAGPRVFQSPLSLARTRARVAEEGAEKGAEEGAARARPLAAAFGLTTPGYRALELVPRPGAWRAALLAPPPPPPRAELPPARYASVAEVRASPRRWLRHRAARRGPGR